MDALFLQDVFSNSENVPSGCFATIVDQVPLCQDPYLEYQTFLDLGVDGFFTDFPASLER